MKLIKLRPSRWVKCRSTAIVLLCCLCSLCWFQCQVVLCDDVDAGAAATDLNGRPNGRAMEMTTTATPLIDAGGSPVLGGSALSEPSNLTLGVPVPAPSPTPQSQCSLSQLMDATPMRGWCCDCWNSTNPDRETECRCKGLAMQRIHQQLPAGMQKLAISQASLTMLRRIGLHQFAGALRDIMLTDMQSFETIEPGALGQLQVLRTIYISQAPKLTYLSADVFAGIPSTFRSLRIINCGLKRIPDLQFLTAHVILYMVDLEGNQITQIDSNSVHIKSEQFILDNNPLTYINSSAFSGSEIAKLSFKGNTRLNHVHAAAFAGIVNVQELDLSSTSLEVLPTEGLNGLEILRIQNTHSLRTIPSVYHFKNLREAWLTHSFHCCAFQFPSRHDPARHKQREQYLDELKRTCINNGYITTEQVAITDLEGVEADITTSETWSSDTVDDYDHEGSERSAGIWSRSIGSLNRVSFFNKIMGGDKDVARGDDAPLMNTKPVGHYAGFANNIESVAAQSMDMDDFGEFGNIEANPITQTNATCGNLSKNKVVLQCYPAPDALNPCEDVMGAQWLRTSVWIVVFLAVVGNVAVLVVLFSTWKDVTVSKFLMSHLAFADLCLGLYLLLIAAIDAHSMGEYFNYGYEWQYGFGCKAAGFLTVFASHLSVFTLTIITLERWFAITHAINLNKRINMKAASVIMAFGWVYSVAMSALPLFGISNYSSTSICLPMEARDKLDIAYLCMIVGNSGFAFCFIAVCYAQIYLSLGQDTRQSTRHASRGEMTIAKKMALLVFTNFACWAPIAFFGLTAIGGSPFIDVAKSKILLVFFYPLNSCADPYLYAILTAQYRRDLYTLLSKFGFCKKKAQLYKMNYSLPMTNQTSIPVPLIGRNSSSIDRGCQSRKISHDFIDHTEDFV